MRAPFGHTSLLGYEPERFFLHSNSELAVRLRGDESKNTIMTLVDNLKQWLPETTTWYNASIKRKLEEREREEIEKIKQKIEAEQKNREMNTFVQTLI